MEEHKEYNFSKAPYQEFVTQISDRSMITENDCRITVSNFVDSRSMQINHGGDNGPILFKHIMDSRSTLPSHPIDGRHMLTNLIDNNRQPPTAHLIDYRENDFISLPDFKLHDTNVNRINLETVNNHQYAILGSYSEIQKSDTFQPPSLFNSNRATGNDNKPLKVRRKAKSKVKKPPRVKKIKPEKIPGKGKIVKTNPCAGKRCGNDCTAKFTEEERQNLHEFYWGMTPSRQRDWLLSCIKEKPPKKTTVKKLKKLKKVKKNKKDAKKSKRTKKLRKSKTMKEQHDPKEYEENQESGDAIDLNTPIESNETNDSNGLSETKLEDEKKDKVRHRNVVYKYIVPFCGEDRQICQQFLLNTLDISQMTLRYTKKHASQFNVSKLDQRGHREPSNKTPLENRNRVIEFIKSLPTVQSHSKSSKKYLPASMRSVSYLHDAFYKIDCLSKVPPVAPVSLKVFRGIFNTSFNIGFVLPKKEKCSNCSKSDKAEKCDKTRHCMQNISMNL